MKKLSFLIILIFGFVGFNNLAFGQREIGSISQKNAASKQVKAPVKLPAKIEETFKKKYGKAEISKVETLKKGEQTVYRIYYKTSQNSQDLSWSDFDEFGKVIQEGKGKAVRKEPAVKTRATE